MSHDCKHQRAVPVHRWRGNYDAQGKTVGMSRYVAWYWCYACGSKVTLEEAPVASGERRNSWPTQHDGDCPFLNGKRCRCPMGNL